MQATVEQISEIPVFAKLEISELERLQPYSRLQKYRSGEIILNEGDNLPAKLYAVLSGSLLVIKTASTGKDGFCLCET